MKKNLAFRAIAITLASVSLLSLTACGLFDSKPQKTKVKKVAKSNYSTSNFVEALTSGEMILEDGGNLSDVVDEIETIEGYTAQKSKAKRVILVVLDYTHKGTGGQQRAIVPIGLKSEHAATFPSEITYLNRPNYTLKELSVVQASVAPKTELKLSKLPAATLLETLQIQQRAILASSSKLSTLDTARAYISLLRGFLDIKQKDGAYLAADNAKRLLAKASSGDDKAAVEPLISELDGLQARLRSELPY